MYPALEKAYNNPVKRQEGIIDNPHRKKTVSKWNIMKHEKGKYQNFLYD